jgi:hypothetical protein
MFWLPEERCVELMVKKLGKLMAESIVCEQLEYLNICV